MDSSLFDGIITRLSELLWGPWTAVLVLFAGVWFSVSNYRLCLRHPLLWLKNTVCSAWSERKNSDDGISPFQSAMTALAGTLGTGNIVGVATALTLGGAGAVFWMWIAAALGMMTAYAENVLGILYRRRDQKGDWLGGPMLYIKHGLGLKRIASLWAFFCAAAAFSVGCITQVNSIALSAMASWHISPWITCIAVALIAAPAILGGVRSVSRLTEKLIPIMAALYILACIGVLIINFRRIPSAFGAIFSGIFTPAAAGGGILGAMLVGVRRGIFTNEAGLGSSVLIHASAETDHPVSQGLWGIFEVFVDTIVMCTLTALVILTSGALTMTDASGLPLKGAELSAAAFRGLFGDFSGSFITAALMLFAFATIVGWSCFGERAFGYLCGTRYNFIYKLAYILMIIPSGFIKVDTVWALSDILNGLMAIPNTIAILFLWKQVRAQTENYLAGQDNFEGRRKI